MKQQAILKTIDISKNIDNSKNTLVGLFSDF